MTMSHVDSVGADLNGIARLVETFRPIRLSPMNYFLLQSQPTAEMDGFALAKATKEASAAPMRVGGRLTLSSIWTSPW
jgi:hypothetical protein